MMCLKLVSLPALPCGKRRPGIRATGRMIQAKIPRQENPAVAVASQFCFPAQLVSPHACHRPRAPTVCVVATASEA